MAAEVPAKDVLCEAMEYLSKLGSNLRTRSENLRAKKIRREKLNNVLAVQKAANKVLLICELSKKSLENVETGIRKVLNIIDTSQASSSNGGKTSNTDKKQYYYFEYRSRKLKIKKRISLKHYTSVRVIAKSLPKSMIDDYPVHYDCKLYRMRQREANLLKPQEITESKEDNESTNDSTSVQHEIRKPSRDCDISDTSKSVDVDENVNDKKTDTEENDISVTKSSSKDKKTESNLPAERIEKEKIRKSTEKSSRDRSHSRDRDQSQRRTKPKEMKEKHRIEQKKIKDHSEERHNSQDSRKKDKKSSETRHTESDKRKFKKLRRIEDSSDDENKPEEVNKSTVDNVEDLLITNISDSSCEEPKSKRRKISVSSDETKTEVAQNKIELESAEDKISLKNNEQNSDNESKKPIIKCVSLTKLLKPDILIKKSKLSEVKPMSKSNDTSPRKHNTIMHTKEPAIKEKERAEKLAIKEKEKAERTARKEKEEVEYWALKRKEVKAFKSKTFVINIARLPEFSVDYIKKHGLRRIIQGGVTLCKLPDDDSISCDVVEDPVANQPADNVTTSGTKRRNSHRSKSADSILDMTDKSHDNDDELIAEANKVKNSLLNESDSDDVIGADDEESAKKDSNSIKSAKAFYSDSENKKSDNSSHSSSNNAKEDSTSVRDKARNAKKTLCNESSSESDKNEHKQATDESDKLKNNLLNNSDSDSGDKVIPTTDQSQKVNKKSIDNYESSTLETALDENLKKNTVNESEPKSNNKSKSHAMSSSSDSDTNKETSAPTKLTGDVSDSAKESDNKEKGPDEMETNEENLADLQRNEKTPEKDSSPAGDSDDKTKTPLSQRLTPQSKKKRIRESVHAKKMLLTYSSSDTEDEELKNVLREIKDSLLHGSDEEKSTKKQEEKHDSRESSPSSSGESIVNKVKKKISYDSSSSSKEKKKKESSSKQKKSKHKHRRPRSENSTKDENSDNSKSSSSKMVRSKSKPGNSSSQNSEAQDSDKDIDGLTNLGTLNKPKTRRRNSSTSEMAEESSVTNTRSRRSKVKPTGLICEEMLKAESSSDAASLSDEENDDEELPSITIPKINGGVEHLVKDDLLGETDSSEDNNEVAEKDDSDSEEKLNARRRKANAISSDSEVGSSRKKDADVKMSDFEESDDSEPTSRSKRKKKTTDSDASVGSGSSKEGGKKKRRRIKSVRDSDESGSDSENEGRNKHGRKNIRKVMGKNQLEEATKKAAREEKERIARIAERQKMYNNLEFDESGKPDEVVLDKVILDFDPETKEPLIEVDRGLVKKLKPHQANGIKFMWNACFESVKRIKKDRGSGCILAHCMGLGKTLQVVALTHTLLTHGNLTGVNRVLVVCPLSTVLNWVNEFKMWLKHAETQDEVDIYELSRYKQNSERAFQLSQWFQHGGVCVLGYEMFRNLSADNTKKFKKKMLKNFQEALVDPGPDLVVCDEGHLLKNEKTSLSQSMNRVRTLRRIVLTGTPLQNNLKEYYCMVQFVKPNLLGKYNEYLNRFVNPITNGQYTDSTEHDIKIMKRRSHVLHKMLDGAVQRRDYGVLAPFLPPKHEYVIFITLSEVQTKLYQHYLDNYSRRPLPGKSSGFLFPDFQSLQRIWTHPLVLKYNSERYEIMQQKKRDKEEEDSEGSLVDFIDDDSTPNETSSEDSSDDSSELSDDSRKKSKKKSSKKNKGKDKEVKGDGGNPRARRGTRANPIELVDDERDDDIVEVKNENPTEWWIKLVEDEVLDDMRNSHKLVLLFDILRQCDTIGDKLLVFSQSLYSLDLIEHFLGKVDEATQEGRIDEKLGGHVGSWSQGVDYFRLDGSTSCENRSIWCKNFNREDNPRARLFLISTRAGGLGINLVAANRVVIFDVSWNPSHDVQSIFRVYRFGQKKPCYVYRFLAMGTMEEKIYERQVTKQAISKRVIDEQQIDRHYAENDLAELYKFEPQPPVPRPIPPLPKDRLFAEMLREHEVQIYKYHEHDSLLENKEEETLSEEERKAAWEDFENEKNKPPPAPFPAPWPMHNGMVPSLLAQQQQQLAYAALAAMLRKDMPNLNDNQLRDMLPLIYNANPQLMQKMSEIYKYTQPGMMNPGMMNPGVMNAGTGGGAMSGMSSASGLQYEPPWQRQQQQQQQMRLQQLMQQQNQMGAKFYAGGLGSRDPVAMALQQQRAREIMLGNSAAAAAAAAGRPRGRPPAAAPRAPAAASADVVDLDSD